MASEFDNALQAYNNGLDNYDSKVDHYKDLLRQAKEEPAVLARQIAGELGAPFISHLLTKGIGKITSDISSAYNYTEDSSNIPSLDSVTGLASDLQDRAEGALDSVTGRVSDLQGRAEGALDSITGRASDLQGQAEGLSARAQGLLDNLTGRASELQGRAGGLLEQVQGQGEGLLSRGQSLLEGILPSDTSSLLNQRMVDIVPQSRPNVLSEGDYFGLRGSEDIDPESNVAFTEPPPSQGSTNIIGRLINRFRSSQPEQAGEEEEGIVSAVKTRLAPMFTRFKQGVSDAIETGQNQIESAAQSVVDRLPTQFQDAASDGVSQLAAAVRSNIQTVSNTADVDFDTAAKAIQGGAKFLIKGQDDFTGVNSEGYELQPDTEGLGGTAAEEVGGEIAAETGEETGGIGDIVGGLVALGGILADTFAKNREHLPPQVKLPNLPIPTFQSGLGTYE